MELNENFAERLNRAVDEELAQLLDSFDNLATAHSLYYKKLVKDYTAIAERIKQELDITMFSDDHLLRFKIRQALLNPDENAERNFFTITSKDDFSHLPDKSISKAWGKSLLYTPLNDHSRQFLKKGDILFCYRQGQFDTLGDALNIRGIYGVGFAASNPIKLFPNEAGHNQWAIEICFPLRLETHLKLRNIQLHPTTIDLTPYNGNRNDSLQFIQKQEHYQTLLNLIYSSNPEVSANLQTLLPDFDLDTLILPEIALDNIYTAVPKQTEINRNQIIEKFIEWAGKPENYQKSYEGFMNYSVLKSWDTIFFNDDLFKLDYGNLASSYQRIKSLVLDGHNKSWGKFSDGASKGAPAAIIGKRNYLRFLEQVVENPQEYEDAIKLTHHAEKQFSQQSQINVPFNPIPNKPRNLIKYGAPGTGKSYLLQRDVNSFFPNEWLYKRITFHPNYSYRNFVGSYKPMPLYKSSNKTIYSSDGATASPGQKEPLIEYKFEPGPFLEMFVRAIQNPNHNFAIIIEEINRANTAAVFGDVFQLLDRNDIGESEYSVSFEPAAQDYLKSCEIAGSSIKLPGNLYLWATMNNADQGVMPLDSAFKRRWSFDHIGLNENVKELEDIYISIPYLNLTDKKLRWNNFRNSINHYLLSKGIHEDKLIGPFFLTKYEIADSISIKNKLLLYLKEDVLRYKSGLFKESLKSFSNIVEAFNDGHDIFLEELEFEFDAS